MNSMPASSAICARRRQSGQFPDQRSGTRVTARPEEQLAPKRPSFSLLALFIAARGKLPISGCMLTPGFRGTRGQKVSSFRGAAAGCEPGTHIPGACVYGFRARRFAPPRNDGIVDFFVQSGTAGSVWGSVRDEAKILHRHPLEESLVLALRDRPQHRHALMAGVPVLAAADPDGAGKGGAEAGNEFL